MNDHMNDKKKTSGGSAGGARGAYDAQGQRGEQSPHDVRHDAQNDRRLSFGKLAAVIIGSTIGSGIFTTTADMAAEGAHTGAVLIGWAIAGAGTLGLVMCFFGLNEVRPDLTNGVYSYAREGFGEFVGFHSAWGYWISALLCNVSYTTLLFGALGYFFPVFGTGNNLISIICASLLIWAVNYLVLRGVKEAAALNVITTISKLVPLFVFVIAVIVIGAFDMDTFLDNFWGSEGAGAIPLLDQIKATTGATVWSFIGIEGAVVLSGRAEKAGDVGKASLAGFAGLLATYVLTAVLSLGVMTPEEMAVLESPQMAGILASAAGPWGAVMINLGVVLSLAGALLGWTIIAADCAYSAAKQGVFMKVFAKENQNESPSASLFITNGIIQVFLVVIYFNDSTYQAFYGLSTLMIMVPYLFSGLYYAKLAFGKGERLPAGGGRAEQEDGETGQDDGGTEQESRGIAQDDREAAPDGKGALQGGRGAVQAGGRMEQNGREAAPDSGRGAKLGAKARFFGLLGSVYGVWMLYSSGLDMLLVTTVLYAPGIIVYALGKRERSEKIFQRGWEKLLAAVIVILALVSVALIAKGSIEPL